MKTVCTKVKCNCKFR